MTPHGWVGFRVVNAGTERGLPGKLSECRSVSLSELTAPNAAKSCERPGSQLTFRTGHMGYTLRFCNRVWDLHALALRRCAPALLHAHAFA
jgi:hypothetical protein